MIGRHWFLAARDLFQPTCCCSTTRIPAGTTHKPGRVCSGSRRRSGRNWNNFYTPSASGPGATWHAWDCWCATWTTATRRRYRMRPGWKVYRAVPLPRQLLLRCSTSCIHAVVSYCRGAAAGAQGLLPAEPAGGGQPGRNQCAGSESRWFFAACRGGRRPLRVSREAGSPSNPTRYHGVFAPNSPHRAWVTKAGRGRGAQRAVSEEIEEDTPATRRAAMTCTRRA